jgi:hypothetical protein
MVSQQLSDQVSYETAGDIGIWTVDDMETALESGELEPGEEHFRKEAGRDSMNAAVVVVGGAENLSKDALEHVSDQWTALAEQTGIDATAYVADGLGRLAISNKNEAEGMDTKGFKDRDSALDWARTYQ